MLAGEKDQGGDALVVRAHQLYNPGKRLGATEKLRARDIFNYIDMHKEDLKGLMKDTRHLFRLETGKTPTIIPGREYLVPVLDSKTKSLDQLVLKKLDA